MNRPLGIPTVISKQYLFSAHFKEGKRISKLYPVKNLFFLSNNLRGTKPEDFDTPVMWRTSDSGEIRMMSPSGSVSSRVMKSQRKICIPPVSLLNHTAASQSNLADANQYIVKLSLTSHLNSMDFKLVHIPFDLLQRPKDKPKDRNVPDEDEAYRAWYQRQVQNKMTGVIGGVLPRIRAIIPKCASGLSQVL